MRLRDVENGGRNFDKYKKAVRGVPFVIDAGLDEYVRRHWENLLAGGEKRFLFPFARAVIGNVTRDGGFPPLLINPIDFEELYRNREQKSAPRGQADTA